MNYTMEDVRKTALLFVRISFSRKKYMAYPVKWLCLLLLSVYARIRYTRKDYGHCETLVLYYSNLVKNQILGVLKGKKPRKKKKH